MPDIATILKMNQYKVHVLIALTIKKFMAQFFTYYT